MIEGEAAISRRLALRLIERVRHMPAGGLRPIQGPLTPREWEIVDLLAPGHTTDDIAAALVISTETVRSHVKSIMRKLEVHSRRDARAAAERLRSRGLGVGRGGPDGRRRDEGRDDDHREGEDLDDDAQEVGRHRVAEDDDAAEDAGDVGGGRGRGDDRDGLAVLQAARRGVEGDDRAEDGDEQPRRDEDAQDAVAEAR